MAAKKKQAGLIPEKYQIPAVIVLSLVFVLSIWRLYSVRQQRAADEEAAAIAAIAAAAPPGSQTAAGAAPVPSASPAPPAPGTVESGEGTPTATLEDLQTLLASLKEEKPAVQKPPAPPRILPRDPFFNPDTFTPDTAQPLMQTMPDGTLVEAVVEEIVPQEPEGPTRDEVLESLKLSGTVVTDTFAMAILNDRYVKAGDTIGPFKVEAIKEQSIILRDKIGREVLYVVAPEFAEHNRPPLPQEPSEPQ